MATYYTNRVLTRQFLDTSTWAGGLALVADAATALSNLLGSSLYVTDGTYAMGFKYAQLAGVLATTGVGYAAGTPVYWKDNTQTIITNDPTLAISYKASTDSSVDAAAGIALNTSAVTSNGVWIQTWGYNATILSPASVVPSDRLVLSNNATVAPTANLFVRVAAGTGPATTESMTQLYVMALASVAASLTTGLIRGLCAIP